MSRDYFTELLDIQPEEKICPGCKKFFVPYTYRQVFCGKNCTTYKENIKANHKKHYNNNKKSTYLKNRIWQENNKARSTLYHKKSHLMKKYGITLEQYIQIQINQNNKCAICKKESMLHVDHDHKTGRVRELLCGNCNRFLGLAKENKETLQNAINYIDKWSK